MGESVIDAKEDPNTTHSLVTKTRQIEPGTKKHSVSYYSIAKTAK